MKCVPRLQIHMLDLKQYAESCWSLSAQPKNIRLWRLWQNYFRAIDLPV